MLRRFNKVNSLRRSQATITDWQKERGLKFLTFLKARLRFFG